MQQRCLLGSLRDGDFLSENAFEAIGNERGKRLLKHIDVQNRDIAGIQNACAVAVAGDDAPLGNFFDKLFNDVGFVAVVVRRGSLHFSDNAIGSLPCVA